MSDRGRKRLYLIRFVEGTSVGSSSDAWIDFRFFRFVASGIFSALLLLSFSGRAHAERLPLRSYSVSDGLAHNEVNKIVRDSRGFLWFCTAGGLSRFDGYTFTNYGTEQGLPHPNVSDLLETRGGEYWVATSAGLVNFNPRGVPVNRVYHLGEATENSPMFTVLLPSDQDTPARAMTVLFEDRAGTIWCGTRKGLLKLDRSNGRLELQPVDIGILYDYPQNSVVSDLVEDRQGALWIASPSGLYRRWPNGVSTRYSRRDGLPSEYIEDLLLDHDGNLWAGSPLAGFFRLQTDGATSSPVVVAAYTKREGLPSDWVFQLFETTDHHYWIATSKGLAEFFPNGDERGTRFHSYTTRNGLSYQEITALNEDLGGNLWLGTNTAGSMKLAHNGFITYDEQDALFQVSAIFPDRAGNVCFRGNVLGDEHTSVFEGAKLDLLAPAPPAFHQRYGSFNGQRFNWFKPTANFDFGWVMEGVTLQDHLGEWWLGSGAGLYHFPAAYNFTKIRELKPLAVYNTADGLAASQVFRLFEDSRSDIWISTINAVTNGLACWERASGRIKDFKDAPGLPNLKDQLPRAFGEDREGHIWIGFNSGVARYSQGSFKFFTAGEELPQGAIMNFFLDHAGRLWLASARSGLIRIVDSGAERPHFINYTTAQGLAANNIDVIIEDTEGNIYAGGGNGLDRLDPGTGRIKHFTTADGLAPGLFRAAFRDQKGTLWFGMTRGLSRFSPIVDTAPASPAVLISGLRVGGIPRLISALGETEITLSDLPANDNQLQLEFLGLSFSPGNVLRYQYRLDGADADWSAPGNEREVNYANLAPGHYVFQVRAANSDGTFSNKPATVIFTVLKPVWERWWFLTMIAVLIGIATYSIYRYRVSRILAFANMRTRIATDLHDDIGSGLSRMAILSEVVKRQVGESATVQSAPLLTEIADSARTLVEAMRDIVWAIDPRRDDLSNVVFRARQFASDVLEPQNITLDFQVPSDLTRVKLDPEQRRHLFLILKEAFTNISKHARCDSVLLRIVVLRNRLELEIRDNGSGFSRSTDTDSTNESRSGGLGLDSMQSRAQELGGDFTVESSPGNGTCLKLLVPIKKR